VLVYWEVSMSVEANKALVQRYVAEPWNKGKVDALDELCGPNFQLEGLGGVDAFKAAILDFRRSFPDLTFTVEEIIAEGDKVAYRWSSKGTHQGEFAGIAPTGKVVTATGITIIRIIDGKVVDDRFESSGPTIEEQLTAD
jgi:predicted ester cyclase